jgi:hypothetical protein
VRWRFRAPVGMLHASGCAIVVVADDDPGVGITTFPDD